MSEEILKEIRKFVIEQRKEAIKALKSDINNKESEGYYNAWDEMLYFLEEEGY